MDKFPSSTTIWHVLRKFEAGVAGGGSTRNLTARGVAASESDSAGARRLFYEIPMLQVLGRELSTFEYLQKTLAQLGYNSGNVLFRLSFRQTEEPLEVAMVKIQDYFKAVEDDMAAVKETRAQPVQAATNEIISEQPSATQPAETPSAPTPSEQPPQTIPQSAPPTEQSADNRPITVFSPPTNNTPRSAQIAYNEDDYVPSVEHAQAYQRRLNTFSRPTRLPTDAELAQKATAEEERLSTIPQVDVKVRLPDQSQVVAKFGQPDTGKSLYDFVRGCLVQPFAGEKFLLTLFPTTAGNVGGGKKLQNAVPDTDAKLLIKDLGMTGRVLVSFTWDAGVAPSSRTSPLLKPELQSQAQQHVVEQPVDTSTSGESSGKASETGQSQGQGEKPARKPGTLPKWLKLPGKK